MKEPEWILEKVVYSIHLAQITEHGGPRGVRDPALLESALEAPKNIWHYSNKLASPFDLAASYAYKISNNHPFIDGNKRTSYVVSRLFLILNGFDLMVSEEDRIHLFQGIAQKQLSEKELAIWFDKNSKKLIS